MLEAKSWGAYERLLIAWEGNARKIVLEMECKEAIDILKGGKGGSLPYHDLDWF